MQWKFLCLGMVLGCLLVGCAATTTAVFHTPDNAERGGGVRYFQRQYVSPRADFQKYTKVKIDPVDIGRLENKHECDLEELQKLAGQLHLELEAEVGGLYPLLSGAVPVDAQTLVLHPALILVGTPHRLVNAVTTVAVVLPVTSGSAAFEMKAADGVTGELVFAIAEQSVGGTDLKSLTIGNFTKFTHVEAAFKKWSERLAEMLRNKKRYARSSV